MAKNLEGLRLFQAQAFPSWQSSGAFGRGAQSEAALAACARRPKADIGRADGKAVVRDGMLVSARRSPTMCTLAGGGADVR
jgi:hypothetical protein